MWISRSTGITFVWMVKAVIDKNYEYNTQTQPPQPAAPATRADAIKE
jgi:hypothetical protein